MRRTIALLTAVGLMAPLAAHALNERVWMMANGVGSTYNMSTLNAELDATNAGYGTSFRHVTKGKSFGGAVGLETADRWNYGLGYDRLAATTQSSDSTGTAEYRFGANAWRAFAEYALRPIGRSTLFVGGALGMVMERGKMRFASPGTVPQEFKTIGTGPLIEAYVGGNLWASSSFGLTATVGYRFAKVKEAKLEGGYPLTTTNGGPLDLDFTGPTARIGIKLAAKNLSEL